MREYVDINNVGPKGEPIITLWLAWKLFKKYGGKRSTLFKTRP